MTDIITSDFNPWFKVIHEDSLARSLSDLAKSTANPTDS